MCIFCKIVNNELPSYKVYEDDEFLAILDIAQTTDGHTLVFPKKHIVDIFEIDDETLSKLITLTKKLSDKVVTKMNATGLNLLNNTNESAGQSVHHIHFHIIPRYDESDEVTISFNRKSKFDLEEILNKING
ncbi:MAG TPA: HIT family protein [Erysipelotrichaceae bacterium]|jgi:histidine triad (HIT) family protein|nr:HIT family protein [Bacillota bacterium]NLP21932.1 HIT family protein [Erysipelotrichaceae bacterium]HCY06525.1 HIT family protein [Erysipelotrichaceae bacterium]